MKGKFGYYVSLIAVAGGLLFMSASSAQAATLSQKLSGRILLQVQSHGEAWYVNPKNNERYYLGTPAETLAMIRRLATGLSETEFASWKNGAPAWADGHLYLRVQSHGEAYYVDQTGRWHYLGRPTDAWQLLKNQGIGISNNDLAKIPMAPNLLPASSNPVPQPPIVAAGYTFDHTSTFSWYYGGQAYQWSLPLKSQIDQAYSQAPKTVYYEGDTEPAGLREEFYGLFFQVKGGDTAVADLVSYVKQSALLHNWTSDQTAEFAMALIQYIPYDQVKANASNPIAFYPYETLYNDTGICSDKTFLGVSVLRALGYGAAILDFPSLDHSAVGIECPTAYSLNGSGYCYVETTNYFPFGVVPLSIKGGQAVTSNNEFTALFDSSRLGNISIYQKTTGLIYQGAAAVHAKAAELQAQQTWIEQEKTALALIESGITQQANNLQTEANQLEAYRQQGNISAYNNLVEIYNSQVATYDSALSAYQQRVNVYNAAANKFNADQALFYQGQ
jgi:hypothetical protein